MQANWEVDFSSKSRRLLSKFYFLEPPSSSSGKPSYQVNITTNWRAEELMPFYFCNIKFYLHFFLYIVDNWLPCTDIRRLEQVSQIYFTPLRQSTINTFWSIKMTSNIAVVSFCFLSGGTISILFTTNIQRKEHTIEQASI